MDCAYSLPPPLHCAMDGINACRRMLDQGSCRRQQSTAVWRQLRCPEFCFLQITLYGVRDTRLQGERDH